MLVKGRSLIYSLIISNKFQVSGFKSKVSSLKSQVSSLGRAAKVHKKPIAFDERVI